LYQLAVQKVEQLFSQSATEWWRKNQQQWYINNPQIELSHIITEARSQSQMMSTS